MWMKTKDQIEGRTSMRLWHLIFNHWLQQLSQSDWLYMSVLIRVNIGKQELIHKHNTLSAKCGIKTVLRLIK